MSQSSHPMDPTWSSVPVAKFSHNSSPFGTRSFTWNHVSARNDLDFILRNARVADQNGNFHTRILMKINAGAEELELQDLGELLQHLYAPGSSSAGESPVQIVIKSPFLAMRYPKPGNIVRRIQLKFHNDHDFTRVLNFVKDLGLPITETPTGPSISRPGVSPSPSLLSATSTSTSFSTPSMVSSSSATSSGTRISLPNPGTGLHAGIRPNVVEGMYEVAPNSQLNSDFKVPLRPNSSIPDLQRSFIPFSAASHQIIRPATTSNSFSPPSLSSSTSLDLSNNSVKPPASLYISQMGRMSPGRTLSYPILSVTKSSQGDSGPNMSLFQSQVLPQNNLFPERTDYPERQLTESPFFASKAILPRLGQSASREVIPSSNNSDAQHPDSQTFTSNCSENSGGLNLWVPPKRELPFPKPREVSMQRSASISDISSVPKPTPIIRPGSAILASTNTASTPAPKPAKKRIAQRKAPIAKAPVITESPPPEKESSLNATTSQIVPQDEPSPLAAKSAAAVTLRPVSAASGLQSKAAGSKKRSAPSRPASAAKRPKMVDQATQTQTLSGRDHTSALQSFRNGDEQASGVAAPTIRTPRTTPAPPPVAPPPTPPENYLDAIDAFVTRYKVRPPPQELYELPDYREMDVEERQVLLNNFICDSLENEQFIQLCEDTSNTWRRIGLGM